MLKHTKKIAIFLVLLLMFSVPTSAFASVSTINTQNFESLTLDDFDSFEDIPKELLEPGFYNEDEIIYIPEEYLDPYHADTIDTVFINSNSGSGEIQTFAIGAAAGVYAIPGIGQVA